MSFTAKQTSSDGGLLLLREVESQIGILKSITDCIVDTRHPGYVQHTLNSMLTQRVLQIAAGYEDGNDCDTLGDDVILKICSGVSPEEDKSLSSQPTMSRFENSISRKELYNMGFAFIDHFINSYSKEPAVIILDSDDTNSNTYGTQQLALFNEYYHEYCYMPLHISKELMAWAENQPKVHFLTGLAGNKTLHSLAAHTIESAKKQFQQTGQPVKRYHNFDYAAGSCG